MPAVTTWLAVAFATLAPLGCANALSRALRLAVSVTVPGAPVLTSSQLASERSGVAVGASCATQVAPRPSLTRTGPFGANGELLSASARTVTLYGRPAGVGSGASSTMLRLLIT